MTPFPTPKSSTNSNTDATVSSKSKKKKKSSTNKDSKNAPSSKTESESVQEDSYKANKDQTDLSNFEIEGDNPWLNPSKLTRPNRDKKEFKNSVVNKRTDADEAVIQLSTSLLLNPKSEPSDNPPVNTPQAHDTKKSKKKGKDSKETQKSEAQKDESSSQSREDSATGPNKDPKMVLDLRSGSEEQKELVQKAFQVDDDPYDDFKSEWDAINEPPKEDTTQEALPGWGSWNTSSSEDPKNKKNKKQMKTQKEGNQKNSEKIPKKKDQPHFIENHVNSKLLKNFQVAKLASKHAPGKHQTAGEYLATLKKPIGHQWNPAALVNRITAPKAIVRPGQHIPPLEKKFVAK